MKLFFFCLAAFFLDWLWSLQFLCAPPPRWSSCFLETHRHKHTQTKIQTGKIRGRRSVEALIVKPPGLVDVCPPWVVSGEVSVSSLEHISTNLCTTKSMVSISSLPFNCSQLEHVAFWHGRAGLRGHSEGSVKVQQVCSCCSISVQFASEPWLTGTQSFHQFIFFNTKCEPQSHLCTNLMWHTKDFFSPSIACAHILLIYDCVCVCRHGRVVGKQDSRNQVLLQESNSIWAEVVIG